MEKQAKPGGNSAETPIHFAGGTDWFCDFPGRQHGTGFLDDRGDVLGIRASAQTGLLLAQCLTPLTMFALLFGLVGSTPVLPMVCRKAEQQTGSVYVCLRVLSYVGALILLLVDILHLSAASYVPFIYFQF